MTEPSNMIDQLNQDIKAAMKSKEKDKLEAIRYLKSMLLENKTSGNPKPELDVAIGHHKKLEKSLENYPKDSEAYLKITNEIQIIQTYLPKPLSDSEVEHIIDEALKNLSDPNMGSVMKIVREEVKGRFDGKKLAGLVNQKLQK